MREPRKGGIDPVEIDGLKIGVEVTRLLFAKMKGGSSPFNTYERLKLQGDVRLAVWDKSSGIMPGTDGRFVVHQPAWTRERFGNWLHSTRYGLHTAIDIFATHQGVPEEVISPVEGTVYKVYNRDISPDDRRRIKTINLYGDASVGQNHEKVLYRFHHLSEILVSDGESVKRGQVIGLTGHTGFNPKIGDHLHLEIRLNPSHFGQAEDKNIFATIPVNPYNFLLDWWNSREKE
jgi:murein DD-endopeptidase MepM/ murein hydrolase activator NlpD